MGGSGTELGGKDDRSRGGGALRAGPRTSFLDALRGVVAVVQRRDARVADLPHLDLGHLVGHGGFEAPRVAHLAALGEDALVVRDAPLRPRGVDRQTDRDDREPRQQDDERNEGFFGGALLLLRQGLDLCGNQPVT